MLKVNLIASATAIALVAGLGGCASAGSGASSSPYAGPHNHQRDAKQGTAGSPVQSGAPAARKSLRPAA